ncbi:MAG: nucleotide sugar dehydrogenase [Chitinophagaceae bacterium]|nr:nucleotide sugar dehydrogenase [Chitinophagaceae bacterium]
MLEQIKTKEKKVGVIGLGYVGLPVALALAKKATVIGFDINEERVKLMQNNIDPSKELTTEDFEGCDITFTNQLEVLKQASFFIVAVPTPVYANNVPDLTAVKKASETVGKVLKKGDYVVFESTVYPGCTEDDCLPVIEEISGLKMGIDFKLGYSPERINPGDKQHTLHNVIKVVSGCDEESLEVIADVYSLVVEAGVHKATSIKVAEASKIIENTQRDMNIALMNELSQIFDRVGINTYEVLEAAGTKWNFLKFSPGLVGGHCIGVDPYYLTYKASDLGYTSKLINTARLINDSMGKYVAEKAIQHIIATTEKVKEAKVLVMGTTFKEDVSDIRNSKVANIINHIKSHFINVDIVDPHANSEELHEEYGYHLIDNIANDYDVVIVAVAHKDYYSLTQLYFENISKSTALIIDLKGIFRNKINSRAYWSL